MKKKGITLVELMVVMAISVIVLSIINTMFFSTNKLLNKVDNKSYLQDLARGVINSVGDDIKNSTYATTDVSKSEDKLFIDGIEFGPVDKLQTPIVYVEKNGVECLYGIFNERGQERYKKIDLNNVNNYKFLDENIKVLGIEDRTNEGALTSVFSINLTVKYKKETKTYNTSTFIIKEGKVR